MTVNLTTELREIPPNCVKIFVGFVTKWLWSQVDRHLREFLYYASFLLLTGQVAQLVERGPEKAGVGGSIPSLATINFNNLQIAKNIQKSSREQYAYIGYPD